MSGKLYGVGLGPGDPELISLKAYRLLKSARIIAYPHVPAQNSFARSIAAPYLPPGIDEIALEIPMTIERFAAQKAYDRAANDIASLLKKDQDIVALCEGDPLFYGSFMYLLSRLAHNYRVEIVPGITSVSACAAAMQKPLVGGNKTLTIIPAPLAESALIDKIKASEISAIIKLGRHLKKVCRVLDALNLTAQASYIERATLSTQKITPLVKAPLIAPYFSMILIYQESQL